MKVHLLMLFVEDILSNPHITHGNNCLTLFGTQLLIREHLVSGDRYCYILEKTLFPAS